MIRKAVVLAVASALFVYVAWTFYTDALRYDPLGDASSGKAKAQRAAAMKTDAKLFWSAAVHEGNLFSPGRTYLEPKPVPVAAPPPPPPEPPPKRPEIALKGIVLDTFGDYVGYLEINQAKPVPMRRGDKVEDVEVFDISERRVVLKWNTETITINIDKVKTIDRPRMIR